MWQPASSGSRPSGDRQHGLDAHIHAVIVAAGMEGLAQFNQCLVLNLGCASPLARSLVPLLPVAGHDRLFLPGTASRLRFVGGMDCGRSDARSVGKECVSTCKTRWSADYLKK